MAHAATTTHVAFPFADMSLSSTAVKESDLGCAVNVRGDVAAPMFYVGGTGTGNADGGDGAAGAAAARAGALQLVDRDVPHESLNKVVEVSSKVSKLNELLGIKGELSVHFGNIGGGGHGSFTRSAVNDRKTFSLLQKVTKTVSHTSINTSLLAQAVSQPDNAHVLHPKLRVSPASAQQFVDEQGAKFVSSVTKGGVAFRRITYTCASAQQSQRIQAGLTGSFNLGIQVDFTAEFDQTDEEENTEIQISIEVKAAGGNTGLLAFTHDVNESNRQLESWQASVTVGRSVVVAAEFKDVGNAYIPLLQWGDHDIAAFNRNVNLARREYWDFAVQKVGATCASKHHCITHHQRTQVMLCARSPSTLPAVMLPAPLSEIVRFVRHDCFRPTFRVHACLTGRCAVNCIVARTKSVCARCTQMCLHALLSPVFRPRSTKAWSEPGRC